MRKTLSAPVAINSEEKHLICRTRSGKKFSHCLNNNLSHTCCRPPSIFSILIYRFTRNPIIAITFISSIKLVSLMLDDVTFSAALHHATWGWLVSCRDDKIVEIVVIFLLSLCFCCRSECSDGHLMDIKVFLSEDIRYILR